jgi:hypothetical protein
MAAQTGSVLNWQLPTGHWQLFLEVEETAMVPRAAAKEMKEDEWEAW